VSLVAYGVGRRPNDRQLEHQGYGLTATIF
jgi:hypothetical protein